MLGTTVNTVAIILGGALGLLFGHALSENMKSTLIQGLGLAVLLIGGSMALQTSNALIVILSLVIGGVIGELIDIELRLHHFGAWMESRVGGGDEGRFTRAFVSTSLIFCVGAMAIMGAIESGLTGNHSILFAKSLLDGITAMVFASSMGIGVLAAAIPVLVYQGAITLAASALQDVLSQSIINEMTAAGGLLIFAIGLNILDIKEIKVGNLMPGIFVAIPLTMLFASFNLGG